MNIFVESPRRSGARAALLILCTAAMVAAPFALRAQTSDTPQSAQQGPPAGGLGRGGPRMEERQIEMLTKQLNLTSEQVAKVKAIDDDFRAQMMALREDTSISRDQKRPRMEAIRKDQQTKIKATLTEDQKAKYEAIEARMRERREERRDEGGTPAPPPPPPSKL